MQKLNFFQLFYGRQPNVLTSRQSLKSHKKMMLQVIMMFSLPFMLSFMMMIRLFHLCGQSIMMILRHFTSIFWKTESCTVAIMVFFHVLNFRLRMPTLYPVFRGYPLSILLYILMIINLIFFHRLKQENSMRKMEKSIFRCRLPAITPQPTVGTSNAFQKALNS